MFKHSDNVAKISSIYIYMYLSEQLRIIHVHLHTYVYLMFYNKIIINRA